MKSHIDLSFPDLTKDARIILDSKNDTSKIMETVERNRSSGRLLSEKNLLKVQNVPREN